MSEDAPTLTLDGNTVYQYAHTIGAVRDLVAARLRGRRERDGRLAYSEENHAARLHEARQHPPLRLMTDAERLEWHSRIPSDVAARQLDEPVTVWIARMVDDQGQPTGEWGLEAHTWERGAATSSLFAVCRDDSDAVDLARHIREEHSRDAIGRLHDLAVQGHGDYVRSVAPAEAAPQPLAAQYGGRPREPLVLSESEWEAALRRHLPADIVDRIAIKDPSDEHYAAWRELHELANSEVMRIGAVPDLLANKVREGANWDKPAFNPPSLAHWTITRARERPDYSASVTAQPVPKPRHPGAGPVPAEHAPAPAADIADAGTSTDRVRLADVHNPQQAMTWAQGLEEHNPEHHVEAKQGFGRWGSDVDTALARKFSDVVPQAHAMSEKRRAKRAATAVDEQAVDAAVREAAVREPAPPDPATLQTIAAEVRNYDPTNAFNCRSAHIMLGKVDPQIDRLIAERFPDDVKIVEKLQVLYPDGLPEAEAASWLNRAEGADAAAASESARPDIPSTPPREDLAGQASAQPQHAEAAAQRGIAHSIAGQRPEVLKRTVVEQPVPGRPRR